MTTKPSSSLRSQFLLNPDMIYLNHGSFGATPHPVYEAWQRWQRAMEAQPTEFLGRRASSLLKESREALSLYLHTSADNITYATNATVGLNIAARSLRLGPEDEVLTTNHEYGALDRTWRFLAQKQGFHYSTKSIPTPINSAEGFLEALWSGVTPRTKVIFLSHITSPTALTFPVKEVCRRARAAGILTMVDGAHAPGQLPLWLDEIGADFYSGNLHKWLCAPKGAAFLYARPEVQAMIEPLVVSWGYQPDAVSDQPLIDYVEWQGTRDISAFLAVPDAIQFQQQWGWDVIREECHQTTAHTVEEIAELSRKPALSPLTVEWFVQMASAPLPDWVNTQQLHNWLYAEKRIEIPVLDWNGQKLVRVSIQGYNTPEEARALVEALSQYLHNPELNVQ